MEVMERQPVGRLRSYLELCRASNLPTVWTNVLAAALMSRAPGQPWPWLASLAAGSSLTLTYLAGMALNDVLDVEEDRVKKPLRPIPSGRISRAGAALCAAGLFVAGLTLLALFCSWRSLGAGLALVVTVYLYDRLHRRSAATVLLMAGCRALVFVVTALAVSGTVNRWVAIAAAVQFGYIVTLTAVARWEKAATRSFKVPPIPWLLAGVSVVDGILVGVLVGPAWLAAGLAGAALTRVFQARVRGD